MRIAVAANGRSVHTERWVDALSARGHELIVVWEAEDVSETALARYRPEVGHVVRATLRHGLRRPSSPVETVRPRRLAARFNPDIVQGMYLVRHGWTAAEIGRPLVQFAWGSDVVALEPWFDRSPPRAAANAYYKARTLHAVRCADIVLCDSAQLGATVQRSVPKVRVELVRFGVEVRRDAHSARDWRAELSLPGDAFVLLSARLLRSNYNIDTIIRSFATVAAGNPDLVLIVKDFESAGDSAYREHCHDLIGSLAIGDRVRFVGELERPDLLALYRAADAFVSVPSRDATAASVLEAMAASLPVIASRTDGTDPAVLRDGVSALLVAPRDESELATAMITVARDPSVRESLAQSGRDTVARFGDVDREIERTEQLYADVIARQNVTRQSRADR